MSFEFAILDGIQAMRSPLMDLLMKIITYSGNWGLLMILLTIVLLIVPKTRKIGCVMALALILDALLCNLLIKPMVARIRPYDINTAIQLAINPQKDYSFPSGHTAAACAVTGALYGMEKKKWACIFMIYSALLAFSRLYFYVHYPSDVICGALFGLLCGWAAVNIYKIYEKRNMSQSVN